MACHSLINMKGNLNKTLIESKHLLSHLWRGLTDSILILINTLIIDLEGSRIFHMIQQEINRITEIIKIGRIVKDNMKTKATRTAITFLHKTAIIRSETCDDYLLLIIDIFFSIVYIFRHLVSGNVFESMV